MDINVFVSRRKELKLSQVKLCRGICTQATLSKFESNAQIPSLTILDKLCTRLGMTVDDLYRGQEEKSSRLKKTLNAIENQLMTEDYRRVLKGLAKVDISSMDPLPQQMQYYYLRGIVNALINESPVKVLFDFSLILNDLDEKHHSIFSQLAFVGSGILYMRIQQNEQASFYFEKVLTYIHDVNLNEDEWEGDNQSLRILTLIYYTAEYYALIGNYKLSNQLINDGLELCSDHHVTYYLPRLKFLTAENSVKQHRPGKLVAQLMDEALAFARINRNQVVEVKVAALKRRYCQAHPQEV